MNLKDLPPEIFINILIHLSIDDLLKLYKTCNNINNFICIYLKCSGCNKKISKYKDIYNFKKCNKCNEIICKNCQNLCKEESCNNTYCEYCLVTELCSDCEDYLENSSNEYDL